MIKEIDSSELSISFGQQNKNSQIVGLLSLTNKLNEIIKGVLISCILTDDLDGLSSVISVLNAGTVAVVSSLIVDGLEQLSTRTAYGLVKDDELNGHWVAFNGNYNAENIYFDSNIDLYGTYANVGNINRSDKELSCRGKSLKEVFKEIFDKEINPTLGTNPKNTCTLTNSGSYEVGTKITPSWSVAYYEGYYSLSWKTPATDTIKDGTSAEAYIVHDSNGNTSTNKSGQFTELSVVDNTNYKVASKVQYSNGISAENNKGLPTSVCRLSGYTSEVSSNSITGYRKSFWGTFNEVIDPALLSSDNIRNDSSIAMHLQNGNKNYPSSSGPLVKVYTLIASEDNPAKQIVFALPNGSGKSKLTTYLSDSGNLFAFNKLAKNSITDGTTTTSISQINVNDCAGLNPKEYDIWIYLTKGGIKSNTNLAVMWE